MVDNLMLVGTLTEELVDKVVPAGFWLPHRLEGRCDEITFVVLTFFLAVMAAFVLSHRDEVITVFVVLGSI